MEVGRASSGVVGCGRMRLSMRERDLERRRAFLGSLALEVEDREETRVDEEELAVEVCVDVDEDEFRCPGIHVDGRLREDADFARGAGLEG